MKVAALGIHSAYTSQHAESIGTDIRTKSAAQRLSKSPTLVSTSVKEAPNDSGAVSERVQRHSRNFSYTCVCRLCLNSLKG